MLIIKQAISLAFLICLFKISLFGPTIFATSDPAHPDNFIARFPERSGDYPAYIGEFKRFLTSTPQGQRFVQEVLKDNINGVPANLLAFKRDSTVDTYRTWYNSLITKREEESRRQKLAEFGINASDEVHKSDGGTGLTPLKKVFQEGKRRIEEAEEKTRTLEEQLRALEEEKQKAQQKAAEVSPLKRNLGQATQELEATKKKLALVEALRNEAEAKLSTQLAIVEQDMGSETIAQLQQFDTEERAHPVVAIRKHGKIGKLIEDSSALDLLYEAYTKMIADIKQQIEEHHTVCTDVESLNAVFKEALRHVQERQEKRGKQAFNIRFISDENLDEVFDVIDSALLIAQNYMSLQIPDGALDGSSSEEIESFVAEYKAKQTAKLKRDIRNAPEEKRPGLVEDIFLNQFLDPASAEMMRLKKSDPLDLCLQCTRQFQKQVNESEQQGFYRATALTQIKGKLSKREGFILDEIKKKDAEIYQQRLIILQEKIQKLEEMISTSSSDFAAKPMVLQLFVYRPAFFLLMKPNSTIRNPPFANLNRLELELYYLTKQEKEALFAYLFDIAQNFNAYAAEYQEKTLTKRTPLALDDINALIKMTKESIHAHDETKPAPEFKPSALSLRDLDDFSVKILKFRSGETRTIAVNKRKTEALLTFKKCMSDINTDALEKYLEIKKSALSEAQQTILNHIWEHRDKADPSFSGDIELNTADELLAVEDLQQDQTLYLDLLKYSKNLDSLNLEILKQLKEQLKDISMDIIEKYQKENATTLSGQRALIIHTLVSQRAILEAASVSNIDETIANSLLEAFKVLRDDQQFYGELIRFNKRFSAPESSASVMPKKIAISGGGMVGNPMAGLLGQIQNKGKSDIGNESATSEIQKPAVALKMATKSEDQQEKLLSAIAGLREELTKKEAELEDATSISEDIETLAQNIMASKDLMMAEMKIRNLKKRLK